MKMFHDGGFQVYYGDVVGVGVTEYVRQHIPNAAFFVRNRYGWWGRIKGAAKLRRPPMPLVSLPDVPAFEDALSEWRWLIKAFGPQEPGLFAKIAAKYQEKKSEFIDIPENEIAGH